MRVGFDEVDIQDDLRVTHQGVPFTGEVVEHAPDGRIVALTTYFDGMEDGPYAEWYPTGEPKAAGTVRYGTAVGVHESWHRDGGLAGRDEFDDAGRLLRRLRWAADGTVIDDRDKT